MTLRALGWNHPRCIAPMRACSAAWQRETGVEVAWSWRSLGSFGDEPLEHLAASYDLLVIDHPFCGTAAASGCLVPLDGLLPRETLDALAADAVGSSHASYGYDGRQWGLASDAACQVVALRDDLLGSPGPAAWDDVRDLARTFPGRVALPLAPAHAISSFLTLCANAGATPAGSPDALADRAVAEEALALLFELYRLGPSGTTTWEPPDALARLTDGDELVLVPLAYGYATYSTYGKTRHPCRFADLPSAGAGPIGSVLGGAGLAVSAACAEPEAAAAFAAWVSAPEAQLALVARAGGQPGSAGAWADQAFDEEAGGFYSGTLATIRSAWVRPRDPWWPGFQRDGGRLLADGLGAGAAVGTTLDQLDSVYRSALRRPR